MKCLFFMSIPFNNTYIAQIVWISIKIIATNPVTLWKEIANGSSLIFAIKDVPVVSQIKPNMKNII